MPNMETAKEFLAREWAKVRVNAAVLSSWVAQEKRCRDGWERAVVECRKKHGDKATNIGIAELVSEELENKWRGNV